MQDKSEAEFTIGIWPLKLSVKGQDTIRAMRKPLSVLVVSVACVVPFAMLILLLKRFW